MRPATTGCQHVSKSVSKAYWLHPFRGKITMPWEDMKHTVTLWLKPTAGGGTMFSSNIAALPWEQLAAMSGRDQTCAPLKVGTENAPVVVDHRGVILFQNKKTNPKQPDYYGWAHSGQPTRPAVRIALWARNDDSGRVYLIGNTQEAVGPVLKPARAHLRAEPSPQDDDEPEAIP